MYWLGRSVNAQLFISTGTKRNTIEPTQDIDLRTWSVRWQIEEKRKNKPAWHKRCKMRIHIGYFFERLESSCLIMGLQFLAIDRWVIQLWIFFYCLDIYLQEKKLLCMLRYSLFEYDKICIVIIRRLEIFKLYMLLSRWTKRGLFWRSIL